MENILSQMLEIRNPVTLNSSFEKELLKFQKLNDVLLPEDLKNYFRLLQMKESQYNSRLYRFYPLSEFKRINEQLSSFNGTPDYSNIVNTLNDYQHHFVFADYMFNLFSYSICLNKYQADANKIFIICGDDYREISESFTGFVSLYLNNSDQLQFADD